MKGKTILIGAVSIIGGGILYRKVRNKLDDLYIKREQEKRDIEHEWHHKGWYGGYEAGYDQAAMDAKYNPDMLEQKVHLKART